MQENLATVIVQCPQCQARYRLKEEQIAGRRQLRLRCTKCQTVFPVKAPADRPARDTASASTAMPEATLVSKKGSGLRLPEGKAVALAVTQGPEKGKISPVQKPRVVVGRSGTDIVVNDPEVSRKHCALEVHGLTAWLVDLGSANGTFVNEQKIETCELEHLSEFRIGSTTLMLTVTAKE